MLDMDGVVVDSERHWVAREEAEILPRAVGHAVDAGEITGMNVRDAYDYLDDVYGTAVGKAEFVAMYDEVAATIYRQEADCLAALPGTLADLPAGTATAVVSSSPHRWIDMVLDRFDLSVDAVVSAEDVAAGKPAPDVYERAAERLGVAPRSAVAVEDSAHGLAAATAAGAYTVGLLAAHTDRAALADADEVVADGHQLRERLLSLTAGGQ